MRIEDVLAELNASDSLEFIRLYWEETQASLPSKPPDFLDPAEFRRNREYVGLGPELDPLLEEAARRVRENPALLRLIWHCCRLLHDHPDYTSFSQWPALDGSLGDSSGSFYLLIALTAIPTMRKRHRQRGIPEEVSRNCCGHLQQSIRLRRLVTDAAPGLSPRALNWLRNHIAGDLFRLGRMEYMLKPFRGQVRVFRHRQTGEVAALAEDGLSFTPEGYIEREAPGEQWTSRFAEDEESIVGHPISPHGVAIRREVRLPRADWRRVLSRGDTVAEMHIPAGGGMTLEASQDSMRRALEFFPRYFPERPFVGFGCTSWILGTDLQEMLPPDANLVRFQREVFLFPIPTSRLSGLFHIFGTDRVDPATAPRHTSLYRAVLDRMAEGKPLRSGGMFLLVDDFAHFGSQRYIRRWPPVALREALGAEAEREIRNPIGARKP